MSTTLQKVFGRWEGGGWFTVNLAFCFGPKLWFWTWTKLNKTSFDTLLKPLWKLLKRPLKHPWNFTEKNFKTSLGKPPKKISQKDHLKKTFLDYHRLVLSLAILNYLWLSLSSIRVQVEAQESKLSLDISVCLWLFQAILGYPSYLYQVSGCK